MRRINKHIVSGISGALLATLLVMVGVYTGKHFTPSPDALNGSDTTIVINHYYDTTIYQTKKVYQTINKSYYYKNYDTNIILNSSACDSVRMYKIKDESDSIEIYGNAIVHGELIDHSLQYRWLLPYSSEITKTIYVHDKGLTAGLDMLVGNGLAFGINGGWRTETGLEYKIGYFTNRSVLVSVQKDINFDFRKIMRNKTNSEINNNDL